MAPQTRQRQPASNVQRVELSWSGPDQWPPASELELVAADLKRLCAILQDLYPLVAAALRDRNPLTLAAIGTELHSVIRSMNQALVTFWHQTTCEWAEPPRSAVVPYLWCVGWPDRERDSILRAVTVLSETVFCLADAFTDLTIGPSLVSDSGQIEIVGIELKARLSIADRALRAVLKSDKPTQPRPRAGGRPAKWQDLLLVNDECRREDPRYPDAKIVDRYNRHKKGANRATVENLRSARANRKRKRETPVIAHETVGKTG